MKPKKRNEIKYLNKKLEQIKQFWWLGITFNLLRVGN